MNQESIENTTIPIFICGGHKTGMEEVDREKVNDIIFNASKGSAFFENEERRTVRVKEKSHQLYQHNILLSHSSSCYRLSALNRKATALFESLGKVDVTEVFLHIDVDMFFCAVESRDNPALTDQPFVVGSMSMISTANYVARRYGVRAAMPGFIALKLCPNLIFIEPDYEKYAQASKIIHNTLAKYDFNVRMLSCDEASLDLLLFLKENNIDSHNLEQMNQVVQAIRTDVYTATRGLTCSGGVAHSRLLAKICSNERKPNGHFFLLDQEAQKTFVDNLGIAKVPGIGRHKQQLLEEGLGITVCSDIRRHQAVIFDFFSRKTALFLFRSSLGIDSFSSGQDKSPTKEATLGRQSISCERTFLPTRVPSVLQEHIQFLASKLEESLKKKSLLAMHLSVKVKFEDFTIRNLSQMLKNPTRFSSTFCDTAVSMISQIVLELNEHHSLFSSKLSSSSSSHDKRRIRLLGLRVARLSSTKRSTPLTSQKNVSFYEESDPSASNQHTLQSNVLSPCVFLLPLDNVSTSPMNESLITITLHVLDLGHDRSASLFRFLDASTTFTLENVYNEQGTQLLNFLKKTQTTNDEDAIPSGLLKSAIIACGCEIIDKETLTLMSHTVQTILLDCTEHIQRTMSSTSKSTEIDPSVIPRILNERIHHWVPTLNERD